MKIFEIRKKVKEFYEKYAEEFSHTRVYPWKEVIRYYPLFNDGVLLDIGCGNGRHTELLFQFSNSVIGIDISFNLLKIAKARFKDKIFMQVNADMLHLPLRNSCISGMICIATIHHIPSKENRLKAVKECRRVLERRGIAIFTSWSLIKPAHLLRALLFYLTSILKGEKIEFGDCYISWAGIYQRYFHLMTPSEMKNLLKDFRVLLLTTFGKSSFKDNILAIAFKL